MSLICDKGGISLDVVCFFVPMLQTLAEVQDIFVKSLLIRLCFKPKVNHFLDVLYLVFLFHSRMGSFLFIV